MAPSSSRQGKTPGTEANNNAPNGDGQSNLEDVEQGHDLDLEGVENYVPTPPDGGWGWVIVFASFLCMTIVDGVTYTFGVLLPDLQEFFQEPKSKVSLVGSLLCGVYLFVGPIVSSMTNKYGCRPVVIVGSILSATSMALATLSPNIVVMIVTYGIMGGLGIGMVYLPAIVSVGYYFERRRAFATGLAVCGSGVGTFVFPPLIEFLLDKYGWRGAVLILAGVMLQGCWFGCLMRPLTVKSVTSKAKKPRSKNIFDRVKETTNRSTNTAILGSSINDLEIKAGVNKAKLQRQQTIQDNDSYIGSKDSIIVSLRSLNDIKEEGNPTSPTEEEPESKTKTFIIRTESEEGEMITEEKIVIDTSKLGFRKRGKKHHKSKERLSSHLEIPGVLPGGVGGSRTNLSNLSTSGHNQTHLQLNNPQGQGHSMRSINLSIKDLARPLYRKDIFYSGSVYNIPELQSQRGGASYKANVTTIPGEMDLIGKSGVTARCINLCCACLPRPARDVLNEMIDLSLFLDMSFMLICLGNLTAFLGFFVPFMFLVDYAVTMGISKSEANFLISIIGITNTVGRVVTGKLADLRLVDSLVITYLAIVMCGVSTILYPFVSSFALLAALAAGFGIGMAAYISLSSIVICDRLGVEKLTNGFGLLSMARGVSSMAGPPFAGSLYDSSKSYNMSFTIAGALLVVGAVCHVFLHLPSLRPKHHQPDQEKELQQHSEQEQQQKRQQKQQRGDGEDDEEVGNGDNDELGPLMGSKPRVVEMKHLTEL